MRYVLKRPAFLGNARLDKKLGITATYLTENKRLEVDAVLEHNFTEENRDNINPPNETYSSVLFGGEILPSYKPNLRAFRNALVFNAFVCK